MQEVMPDRPAPEPKASFWKAAFAPRRVLLNALMVLYCLALFLAFGGVVGIRLWDWA